MTKNAAVSILKMPKWASELIYFALLFEVGKK